MRQRNHWWDWLKLVAAWAMLCDHLRFVWPEMAPLFWIGRIAFPLFGVIAAANFAASRNQERYILKLLIFGFLAEIPFQLLTGSVGNILFLFAFTFAAVRWLWWIPALGACFCVYGLAGAVPVALWCFRRSQPFLIFGGALMNPFPFAMVSSAAALFPRWACSAVPAAPPLFRDWIWWFYPVHLLVFLAFR